MNAAQNRYQRTQGQRRQATIAGLTDATIAAIAEIGYPQTTIDQIVHRAGVTKGALFRHFPARLDVIEAAAQQAAARQLEQFREGLAALSATAPAAIGVEQVLVTIRALTRRPEAVILRELAVNARTDTALRERVGGVHEDFYRRVTEIAGALPMLAGRDPVQRRMLSSFVICLFTGEAVWDTIQLEPDAERHHLAFLLQLATGLGINDSTRD
ncbi:helix-turn-helix domain-containing protein [Nocardia sp. NPDC048505]|uniref:TetR/AcrR family transcriptional regulator n=1 Tax=Nocardia sp. NPDC048505 TaxID=3155756 RepID=UPI0034002282